MAYQMTCPKCGHEFAYNKEYYDTKISELGVKISKINAWLSEYKTWPYEKRVSRRKEREEKIAMRDNLAAEASKLKAFRKSADKELKQFEYNVFKRLVRERLGEAEFMELIAEMEEEIEAYKLSDLMRHEYTRSNSKANVTSVNKL